MKYPAIYSDARALRQADVIEVIHRSFEPMSVLAHSLSVLRTGSRQNACHFNFRGGGGGALLITRRLGVGGGGGEGGESETFREGRH